MTETSAAVALAEHRDELTSLAMRHGLHDLAVFGSVARGDDTVDSDIDLQTPNDPEPADEPEWVPPAGSGSSAQRLR